MLIALITLSDLKKEHVSRPRNPLIAEVFFRRGLIERWGRGTQRIVELCRTAGQPEPDFEEQAGNVLVRFRLSQYTPPLRVSHDLTERQRSLLQLLHFHCLYPPPPPRRSARADGILRVAPWRSPGVVPRQCL